MAPIGAGRRTIAHRTASGRLIMLVKLYVRQAELTAKAHRPCLPSMCACSTPACRTASGRRQAGGMACFDTLAG